MNKIYPKYIVITNPILNRRYVVQGQVVEPHFYCAETDSAFWNGNWLSTREYESFPEEVYESPLYQLMKEK